MGFLRDDYLEGCSVKKVLGFCFLFKKCTFASYQNNIIN